MSVSSPIAPSRKFPVPLSYFSMPLGLSALGLSWRYGASMGFAPPWPAEVLLAVATLLWLLLIAAYAVKVWRFRADFLADLQDLVQCCFLSMIPITLLLLAMALLPYARLPAMLAVMLGVGAQLAFAMYRAAGLWRGSHTLAATTPVVYLPTVAAAFVSTSAFAALGFADYAWLFFGMGVFSWLSLEGAILLRLRVEQALAPAVRGIVGIQLAPPFVACGAYFAVHGGAVDGFALMLIGYGCLQGLFLLRLLPWLLSDGFFMSFWGFSFGLAAMCGCGLHLLAQGMMPFLAWMMVVTGSGGIALLVLATFAAMRRGRFWLR